MVTNKLIFNFSDKMFEIDRVKRANLTDPGDNSGGTVQ